MTGPKRRHHCKSRRGCSQCKQKKIKCNEAKPSCGNCERHRLSCSFVQLVPVGFPLQNQQSDGNQRSQSSSSPSRSPLTIIQYSPPKSSLPAPTVALSSLPQQFSTLDLELLHFYTTTTSQEIVGYHMTGTNLWQTSLVTLAFQHPFLLSSLFTLSALHLVHLHSQSDPDLSQKYTHIATAHHLRSIAGFRSEIQTLTAQNAEACCACALGMALLAWTSPGTQGADIFFPANKSQVPWYKLHQGGAQILLRVLYQVERGEFGDMVHPWTRIHTTLQPEVLAAAMAGQREDHGRLDFVAECWNEERGMGVSEEDKGVLDEALNVLRYVFTISTLLASDDPILSGISMSSCFATFLWLASIPPRFCELVEERCPQALVLAATWCVLLKRVDDIWWVRGKAESLFGAVKSRLGSEWDEWLEWPIEDVEGDYELADGGGIRGLKMIEEVAHGRWQGCPSRGYNPHFWKIAELGS